jgi:dinuclear metal center YbgI/SA1388 family protein
MINEQTPLPELSDICGYLHGLLEVDTYQDMALNGLQIESPVSQISKVGFAVDSGLSVMQRAAARGCNLLVVHHGLLWGKCEPFTGPLARKLQLCMVSGLSLYAAHLPLDGHLEVGNAAQIAQGLGMVGVEGFLNYGPRTIGIRGELPTELSLEAIFERVSVLCKNPSPLLLPFGKKTIRTVAVVTGSGSTAIPDVAHAEIDLLISGEPKQEAYHRAKELGCSVLFAGHYATETFGVRALERVLAQRFRVETEWIDEPTGI